MRSDIVPGGSFPDYELPDHTGKVRKLSELQGDDPLILTLARGHYCPKEHQQHLELAAFYPKVAVAYTQIATIATDDHHTLQEFRLLQYAAENGDMRLWCWCRRNFDKIVAQSNMPREKMTHGDYIRARKLDRDVMGRRIK
jgi:AhpC/TSA family protein